MRAGSAQTLLRIGRIDTATCPVLHVQLASSCRIFKQVSPVHTFAWSTSKPNASSEQISWQAFCEPRLFEGNLENGCARGLFDSLRNEHADSARRLSNAARSDANCCPAKVVWHQAMQRSLAMKYRWPKCPHPPLWACSGLFNEVAAKWLERAQEVETSTFHLGATIWLGCECSCQSSHPQPLEIDWSTPLWRQLQL